MMAARNSCSQDPDSTGRDYTKEPDTKRLKLVDTGGWVEKVLTQSELIRRRSGQPDPMPCPLGPPSFGRSTILPPPNPMTTTTTTTTTTRQKQQQQQQIYMRDPWNPTPRYLSPPDVSRSPGLRSTGTLSRRSSSAFSSSTPTASPVPSQATVASGARRTEASPPDSSTIISTFSDLDLDTRAGSAALDDGDVTATFGQIHNVPQVHLVPRETTGPSASKLERLPREVFMRIMMYCGYKDQVLLRQCNYNFYQMVDLEVIPWEEKTATILMEERDNPKNFPRKPPKVQDNEDDGGALSDEEGKPSKRSTTAATTTKGKNFRAKGESSEAKQPHLKTKAHPDTLGKWGCFCCYKILPPQYFEGRLLEDKEGRTAKNHKNRGSEGADSDKKVDMRVEYVQVLEVVPGRELPDWLTGDRIQVAKTTTSVETYVKNRMLRGVNRNDLRAYYKDITKDTHLVAPLRGVTPVFTPSNVAIPKTILDGSILQVDDAGSKTSKAITSQGGKASPFSSTTTTTTSGGFQSSGGIPPGCETHRPLYKNWAKPTARGDMESGSYSYEIRIPRGCERDRNALELPNSQPVSRICLPQKKKQQQQQIYDYDDGDDDDDSYMAEPTLEVGDVVSLRRVCIPCGTKFCVYRRDCNRKIISKTEEGWWVCDCPEVRQAGKSTGCPKCGRKVIY